MAKTAHPSFDSGDWGKIIAVLGALSALGFLPKKWGTPIAVVGLFIAFGN
ncbi:MAG TPA: hypothetical protein VGH79_12935 [Gaiellaceae bacterium]|jgi:hypothetical protein